MSRSVLIDTDVMVDFLRGNPEAVAMMQSYSNRIILSSIVVAELYAGVRDDNELSALDRLISLFRVIPVSPALARAGGLYKKHYAKSHGVGLADAIIAATVDAENAELKTLNAKHYPMFKGLNPPYTKT